MQKSPQNRPRIYRKSVGKSSTNRKKIVNWRMTVPFLGLSFLWHCRVHFWTLQNHIFSRKKSRQKNIISSWSNLSFSFGILRKFQGICQVVQLFRAGLQMCSTTRYPRCPGSNLRVKKNLQKCEIFFFLSSNVCLSKAYTERFKNKNCFRIDSYS